MDEHSQFVLDRHRMVEQQLRPRGIHDPRVLHVMASVPRELFVVPRSQEHAYEDRAMGIACEQTISQPYIVALMTEALELVGSEHVLEIGTGSGYQTAILAELAGDVVSLERHPALSDEAANALSKLRYPNVELVVGDGTQGYLARAPYDRILVAAAARELPPALAEQLVEGGLLVIPLGNSGSQELQAIRKHRGRILSTVLCGCRFVPLLEGPPE